MYVVVVLEPTTLSRLAARQHWHLHLHLHLHLHPIPACRPPSHPKTSTLEPAPPEEQKNIHLGFPREVEPMELPLLLHHRPDISPTLAVPSNHPSGPPPTYNVESALRRSPGPPRPLSVRTTNTQLSVRTRLTSLTNAFDVAFPIRLSG
ncbi:hypothetical protein BDP55DRAFT_630033 [Colletotrichum godetiae]|uniref:Uncharacterized protein n=1 Tax=Colletotrichum godetiae TaxID=1209918 RepID=A0AAJ0EZV3_9PEZI|nr:uncharacterized protein BDP55DRAFT_630033 [Colletotrichum godetiae]KAK1687898.1 hypothetical protein BDP55DRAFT_630033 [Colletotrichum godetiae]